MNKHYDYYITSKEVKGQKIKEHQLKFGEKRTEMIQSLCDEFGAVGYTVRNNWGGADFVCELVFSANHDHCANPFMKKRAIVFEGENCFAIRGKGNRKDGIAFNKKISDLNLVIKEIPKFTDWIVDDFGVMRTGMGESTGRGVEMLQSAGGVLGDGLGFRIPNCKQDRHGDVTIPDCFKKITRGQWVDMTDSDD
ncbi:putative Eac protein [Vibrio phage 207E29.1]|nr:putative Eac protein [Vibrio phage 207E29.1]